MMVIKIFKLFCFFSLRMPAICPGVINCLNYPGTEGFLGRWKFLVLKVGKSQTTWGELVILISLLSITTWLPQHQASHRKWAIFTHDFLYQEENSLSLKCQSTLPCISLTRAGSHAYLIQREMRSLWSA